MPGFREDAEDVETRVRDAVAAVLAKHGPMDRRGAFFAEPFIQRDIVRALERLLGRPA